MKVSPPSPARDGRKPSTNPTRPYSQVARAEAQNRTRTALIDAAQREVFGGRWPEASLVEIADRAGVTKQTLLRHFGSKDGLFHAAATRGYEQVKGQRFAAPRNDVLGAIENLLDHYEEWGERAMLIGTVSGSGDLFTDLGHKARQLHYDWVDHAFGDALRRFRGRDRARRRAALIVLCDVHTWWLLSHDLELPRAEVRATLVRAIETLIGKEADK